MTFQTLKIIIVEDETHVRQSLEKALITSGKAVVVGTAGSLEEAFEVIISNPVDAIFLDIKLKGGNAFQLLNQFQKINIEFPPIIMMTGYTEFEFAQKAHNEHREKILRILQKPFWERFDEVFDECYHAILAYKNAKSRPLADPLPKILNVKVGTKTYRISPNDIDYIEVGGSGSIIIITRDQGNLVVQQTLASFMENDLPNVFRIHRNNAVNINKVSHIDHEQRLIYLRRHNKGLSIGRTFYPAILRLIEN